MNPLKFLLWRKQFPKIRGGRLIIAQATLDAAESSPPSAHALKAILDQVTVIRRSNESGLLTYYCTSDQFAPVPENSLWPIYQPTVNFTSGKTPEPKSVTFKRIN